ENASYHTTTVVQTVTTTSAAAPASQSHRTSGPPQLAPYSGSIYSARIPRDWIQEANDEAHSGYVESKWRDPHDSNTSITIDASAGESKPPSSKADEVRSAVSGQPSFSEISTGSRTVAGNDGYEWTFRLSGDQRVDYF